MRAPVLHCALVLMLAGVVPSARAVNPSEDEALKKFCSQTLKKLEDFWRMEFRRWGREYEEPKLVLFDGTVQTACGTGHHSMGPFYCPLDRKVFLDMSFFRELERRYEAPGDFPRAYVIAHEVGHHVQTLLGVSAQVQRQKERVSAVEANKLQVRMELQADALAGVFARWLERLADEEGRPPILEAGDIEEGIEAARAIGDDTLQRKAQGYVVPDSFTHGSAEQRVRWFMRGYQTGDPSRCDAFAVEEP